MIEFELAGKQYRAERLDAFQQLHVSRKIAPLVPALLPVFLEIAKQEGTTILDDTPAEQLKKFAPVMQPFANAFADLPDAAVDFVVMTCLKNVKREVSGNWTPIWLPKGGFMFPDIDDAASMIQIVVRVIVANLGGFIKGLPIGQRETKKDASPASPGAISQTTKTG